MGIIALKPSFTTKSNFVVNPFANAIVSNKDVKTIGIFSMVHKYCTFESSSIPFVRQLPFISTSKIVRYLNSPEITA
jgi:hypothetical protein